MIPHKQSVQFTASPHTPVSLLKDLFFWSEMQTFRSVFHRPYLNSRVHMIVDVVIFQHSMAIVIEVDPDL